MTTRQKVVYGLVGLVLLAAFASPVLIAHYIDRQPREPSPPPVSEVGAEDAAALAASQLARDGEVAYMRNCAMCHGYEAVGKVGVAPSLSNADFLALATDEFIRTTVREGRLGTAMAPRRDVSRGDLDNIIAYLRSLPVREVHPVALDLAHKATGDAARGRDHFDRYCSPCHGAHGGGYVERGTAPGIALPGFLHITSDAYILETIKRGRRGTAMRSFLGARGLAQLTEQDMEDIIVFLRSQDPATSPDFTEALGLTAFDTNCASCHQPGGAGLVGVAPSLRSPEFLSLATDDFIRRTVRRGRPGTTMVPRRGITNWELDGIIDYLRNLPTNDRIRLKVDESLSFSGDADQGRQNFVTYCAPCHGPRGEGYATGGSGPAIGLPGFLGAVPDDYIFQTVKYGRTGTPMRPFSGPQGLAQLDDQQIKDIIVFLRSRTVLP
jgi:cytochrome c oxidase cbb3-type subunit 3